MNQRLALPGFLLLVATGCGSDALELAPVEGTVSYQGKRLDHGDVVFTPAQGTPGPQALGKIQEDGTFTMMTMDRTGAVLGHHLVTVHCRAKLTPEQSKSLIVPKTLIPLTFGNPETTPFKFEVKRGKNDCPLELK